MRDYELYGVDHYRPKSLFDNLLTTYEPFLLRQSVQSPKGGVLAAEGQKGRRTTSRTLDAHLVQVHATLIVSSDGSSPLPIGLPAADAAPPGRRGV